jgi:hypothetical protein
VDEQAASTVLDRLGGGAASSPGRPDRLRRPGDDAPSAGAPAASSTAEGALLGRPRGGPCYPIRPVLW